MANAILAMLTAEDRELLAPLLEQVTLRKGEVLHEPLQPVPYSYFLDSGLSSEIATNSGGERVEVGCVGSEGFSGVSLVLGVSSTAHRAFMQSDGVAQRIAAADLAKALLASRSLHMLLLRFMHVFIVQVAATGLANARYDINQRLARWLLMAHDRLRTEDLPLTHDFLSSMLGVRRSGVTDAIHVLEGNHVIRGGRGLITIRNRHELERIAGHSYGVPEAEYRRVLGRGFGLNS